MDTKNLADKGLKLRKELFGEKSVEQRIGSRTSTREFSTLSMSGKE